jgi:hypothetical protein
VPFERIHTQSQRKILLSAIHRYSPFIHTSAVAFALRRVSAEFLSRACGSGARKAALDSEKLAHYAQTS